MAQRVKRAEGPLRGRLPARPAPPALSPALALMFALMLAPGSASPHGAEATPAAPVPGGGAPLLVPDRIKADTVVVLAHPDDEGVVAPLLARWALVEKQRVVNLYLTSGELGTDRVGSIQGPAFGYMRLTELHWTLDRLGVAMFHSLWRADLSPPDDPAQVLEKWGREGTVREMTRYLRLLRPDRVLTWIPGPPSAHPAHMAAGAVALLAIRAASDPASSPEQMATEGLRVHAVRQVLLFGQPEKLAYAAYPGGAGDVPLPGVTVETIPVDAYEPSLRRRLSDVAREAMREQRSVGMGAGLARGGPFDAPLRLVHLFDEPGAGARAPEPPGSGEEGLHLALQASGSQLFFERILADVGAPRIARAFPPRAPLGSAAGGEVSFIVSNTGRSSARASASLALPAGWSSSPGAQGITIGAGETKLLTWSVSAPQALEPRYAEAAVSLGSVGKRSRELARLSFVIDRGDPHVP